MTTTRLLILLPAAALLGCSVEAPPAASLPGSTTVQNVDEPEEEAGGEQEAVADAPASALPQPAPVPEVSSSDDSPERLLLLPATGPLIVDLRMTVDGVSHQEALDRILRDELAAADLDRDGTTWWREVANSTRFRFGEFRYNPDRSMRLFDADEDCVADPDELMRLLTQNVGPTQSFVVRTSNAYRFDSSSEVRTVLDRDGNRTLSPEEIEDASEQLLRLDMDDDEVLTRKDFASPGATALAAQLPKRRSDQAEVAVRIYDRTDWNYAWYSLLELYGKSGVLDERFASFAPGWMSLDADGDGRVAPMELKAVGDMPADLELTVDFGSDDVGRGFAGPELRLRHLSDRLRKIGARVERHVGRLCLSLPGVQLQFFVNEDPMLYDADVQSVDTNGDGKIAEYELASFMARRQDVYRGLVRAWIAGHPDSLYAALDEDGDGVLKARELHGAVDRIRSLDADGDGQLRQNELPDSLVIGFVRGNPMQDAELFTNFQPPAVSDPSHPDWFTAMDANRDGEVSRREFLGTAKQFDQLDDDSDGYVAPGEARMASL